MADRGVRAGQRIPVRAAPKCAACRRPQARPQLPRLWAGRTQRRPHRGSSHRPTPTARYTGAACPTTGGRNHTASAHVRPARRHAANVTSIRPSPSPFLEHRRAGPAAPAREQSSTIGPVRRAGASGSPTGHARAAARAVPARDQRRAVGAAKMITGSFTRGSSATGRAAVTLRLGSWRPRSLDGPGSSVHPALAGNTAPGHDAAYDSPPSSSIVPARTRPVPAGTACRPRARPSARHPSTAGYAVQPAATPSATWPGSDSTAAATCPLSLPGPAPPRPVLAPWPGPRDAPLRPASPKV